MRRGSLQVLVACHRAPFEQRGWEVAVGHGRGTENLTGVLEATVCDPSRSGPAPDSLTASCAKIPAASAGDRTAVFTPSWRARHRVTRWTSRRSGPGPGPHRVPRRTTYRHQPGDLPNLGMSLLNSAPGRVMSDYAACAISLAISQRGRASCRGSEASNQPGSPRYRSGAVVSGARIDSETPTPDAAAGSAAAFVPPAQPRAGVE